MKKILKAGVLSTALLMLFSANQVLAQAKLKIGFISAQSGPLNVLGLEQKRGFEIAMDHLGGKFGQTPIEVVVADSKGNPSATVQEISRLIDKEKVDLIVGLSASNELVAGVKPIVDAKIFFIGMNGGVAVNAGEQCNPYYFNASFQNAQLTTGMGAFMTKQGVKKLYLIGADFEAGYEHTDAAKTGFKGEIVAQQFTPLTQLDFAADIAKIRASGADGVFAFYPGGLGIAFMRQWAQAGLTGKIPVFSNIALTEPTAFQAQGKSVLGTYVSAVYFAGIDNPVNKRFVQDFKTKFGRDPASYAGLAYDAMMLVDSAVKEVKGNVKDQAAFRAALKKANFQSVRGSFAFSSNNHPIQNTYLTVVDERSDGSLFLKATAVIAEKAADSFVSKCPLK
ncbi:MAG: ABC transporter substrate-binding protein [Flavobacteriia bacterium]|jgi:branched-chain amino acid transport system substrate-binding protein|nr:ABC transporter substrate-binding protein [Flavobacteriia bacterium]